MEWSRQVRNLALRGGYLFAMYTGLRGQLNRIRSRALAPSPEIQGVHGVRIELARLGGFTVVAHARAHPNGRRGAVNFGMFSMRRTDPPIGRGAYWFFCRTSHFGCGHIEVAFYEKEGVVVFYAIRNIARANAQRLGLGGLAKSLRVVERNEDALMLRALSDLLVKRGLRTRHAEPLECLQLAVDRRLMRHGADALGAMYRKYDKLHAVFDSRATGPRRELSS